MTGARALHRDSSLFASAAKARRRRSRGRQRPSTFIRRQLENLQRQFKGPVTAAFSGVRWTFDLLPLGAGDPAFWNRDIAVGKESPSACGRHGGAGMRWLPGTTTIIKRDLRLSGNSLTMRLRRHLELNSAKSGERHAGPNIRELQTQFDFKRAQGGVHGKRLREDEAEVEFRLKQMLDAPQVMRLYAETRHRPDVHPLDAGPTRTSLRRHKDVVS